MKTLTFDARISGITTSSAFLHGMTQKCQLVGLNPEAELLADLTLKQLWLAGNEWDRPVKITIEFQEPKIKIVPWKAEEVPLGAWLRYAQDAWNGDSTRYVITAVLRDELRLGNGRGYDFAHVADRWEHSTDGGKTWLPAGRTETTYE